MCLKERGISQARPMTKCVYYYNLKIPRSTYFWSHNTDRIYMQHTYAYKYISKHKKNVTSYFSRWNVVKKKKGNIWMAYLGVSQELSVHMSTLHTLTDRSVMSGSSFPRAGFPSSSSSYNLLPALKGICTFRFHCRRLLK